MTVSSWVSNLPHYCSVRREHSQTRPPYAATSKDLYFLAQWSLSASSTCFRPRKIWVSQYFWYAFHSQQHSYSVAGLIWCRITFKIALTIDEIILGDMCRVLKVIRRLDMHGNESWVSVECFLAYQIHNSSHCRPSSFLPSPVQVSNRDSATEITPVSPFQAVGKGQSCVAYFQSEII